MNFLADYLIYNSGNEVNEHYHLWSAMSALSSIVSRRIWVDQGYFRVYANMYVVLLGPPGNGKTTAMGCAKGLVRSIGNVPFSAQCQSKANLVKEMMKYERGVMLANGQPLIYTPISIFVTELSQFISIDPVKMLDLLVTIYDQDVYDMSTQAHGHQQINGPYMTLLGCTTSDWVTNYLKSDIITGGFTRRALFILEDWSANRRVPRPKLTDEMRAAWVRVENRARQLAEVTGEFVWSQDAERWFDHWYMTREIVKDANVAAFDRTRHTQLLKLAMLLELCRGDALVLHEDTLVTALAMLDKLMIQLPVVFSGIGRNELAKTSTRLKNMLVRAGTPLAKKVIMEELWRDANTAEIYQVFNHMIAMGAIVVFNGTGPDGVTREWVALPGQAASVQQASTPVHMPPAETEAGSTPSDSP